VENSHEDYQTITQAVREWHRILIKIRKQTMRAGSGSALRELITIAVTIYNVSSGIYSFGYLLSQNEKLELMFGMIVVSVQSTIRVLMKVSSSVKIAQEVCRYRKFQFIFNAKLTDTSFITSHFLVLKEIRLDDLIQTMQLRMDNLSADCKREVTNYSQFL
jgi:hypothetical protein